MPADLSVSGRVYRDGTLKDAVLHIDTETGRLVKVARSGRLKEHLDLGRRAVLPGTVDLHVHFRDPGATHKEDWETGTTAAAFGGVTTVVDMPNTLPPTTTAKAAQDKLALAAAKAVVDFGVHAGATWYTDALPDAFQHCIGVKVYMGATTGDLLLEDSDAFPAILQHAAKARRPVLLHAEAQRILRQLRRTETRLEDHDLCRPPLAEVESIYDAMKVVHRMRSGVPRVHVAHAASAEAVHAARQAGFTIGVCPHHILLSTEGLQGLHVPAMGKANPPVRNEKARKALWEQFAAGKIPVLESDHAPHTPAEKDGAFHSAPSGIPGVETLAPIMLARAVAGDVPFPLILDALTVNPARILGLSDRGRLEPGLRADFAAYDLEHVDTVDPDRLHSKCGWTPFEGHDAVFPTHTFLAGHPVIQEGERVAGPGTGRPLPLPAPRT